MIPEVEDWGINPSLRYPSFSIKIFMDLLGRFFKEELRKYSHLPIDDFEFIQRRSEAYCRTEIILNFEYWIPIKEINSYIIFEKVSKRKTFTITDTALVRSLEFSNALHFVIMGEDLNQIFHNIENIFVQYKISPLKFKYWIKKHNLKSLKIIGVVKEGIK